MAEVIDNIKVGEKIKKLLKEHNMTQDALAQKLSISKSAVSQNLRGKSTFDIQNLILIAELFDTTLDALLSLNQDTSNQVFSEYQKVVSKGLAAFKGVPPENLSIKAPDLYGKVLIEYVIDKDALEMFNYLHEHRVEMVEAYYHRARDIYLKVIEYGLKNKVLDIYRYIEKYSQIHGCFIIDNKTTEGIIWILLDQQKNKDVIKNIIDTKANHKGLFKFKQKQHRLLSKRELIDIIAKYKLDNVLKIWLENGALLEDFTDVVEIMLESGYEAGIIAYVDHFVDKPLSWIKRIVLEVQRLYYEVVLRGSLNLIQKFADKKLYTDLTAITKKMIVDERLAHAGELIASYPDALNFRELALEALNLKHITFVDSFMHHLNKDDLNYLFAAVKKDETDILLYLLKNGSLVQEKYYNIETFNKVNLILERLIDEGDKS
ncbi:MAG: helix-turn-helix transcriptional regulator [Acholeplasma sp.]